MREKAGTQGTQDYEKEDLDRKRGMNGIPIRINHQPTCKSYHILDRLHGVTRGGKRSRRELFKTVVIDGGPHQPLLATGGVALVDLLPRSPE